MRYDVTYYNSGESKKFKHWTQGRSAFHSPAVESTIHFPTSKFCTVEKTTSGNRGEAMVNEVGFMEHTLSRTNDLTKVVKS